MSFEKIWLQLIRKDPDLAKPESKVEFTSDNLQSLLLQVYELGRKQGAEDSSDPFDGLFGK